MCLEIYLSEQIFGSRRVLNLFIVPPIFVILFWIFSKKQSKALNFIGNFSMGIYLIHPIVILTLNRIIGIDLIHEKPLFFSIILLIFTLIITICLILIIVKFPFSKYLLTVFKK
jgi:membrane-bound acyltransferase YfiQ involved in biofilm formation